MLQKTHLTDNPIEYIKINSSNIEESRNLIEKHVAEYGEQFGYSEIKDINETIKYLIKNLHKIDEEISPESLKFFRKGIAYHPKQGLSDYFINHIAPTFFNKFPRGEIFIINSPSILLDRSALIRFLYVLENKIPLENLTGFEMLRKWNQIEAYRYLQIISNIILHIKFPYITGIFASNGICLDFIFLFDEPIDTSEQEQGEKIIEDIDYHSYLRFVTDFGKEHVGIENIQNQPERTVYKKFVFNNKPNIQETSKLIEWSINSSSRLIGNLFNLENFTSESDNDYVDPIYAFEYAYTVQHILHDITSILYTWSSYQNKSTLFRIADMLAGLAKLGSLTANEGNFFKELFMPNKIKELSYKNFYTTELFDVFHTMAHKISNNLYCKIYNSIWVKDRLINNSVLVKDRNLLNENAEEINIFCGNLIRALRNTHHGYFTRADRTGSRPSRYFSISTGELPDDLPSLAFLWLLLLLDSQETFIGNPS